MKLLGSILLSLCALIAMAPVQQATAQGQIGNIFGYTPVPDDPTGGPWGPWGPRGPWGPNGPWGPWGPNGPWGPWGPNGPIYQSGGLGNGGGIFAPNANSFMDMLSTSRPSVLAFSSQQPLFAAANPSGIGAFSTVNAAMFSAGEEGLILLPADFAGVSSVGDLDGKVVGALFSTLSEEQFGVAPGNYEIYTDSFAGKLHVYLMSAGNIVAEFSDVEVSQESKPTDVDIKASIQKIEPRWYVCVYDKWVCVHEILQ